MCPPPFFVRFGARLGIYLTKGLRGRDNGAMNLPQPWKNDEGHNPGRHRRHLPKENPFP
jgi:hypothetical protein